MSLELVLLTATHWLDFLALAGIMGSLAIQLIAPPALGSGPARVELGLRRLRAVCLVALLGTAGGELLLRAHTMAGGGVASALVATPTVLLRTKFGNLWIARLLLLGVALVVSSARGRVGPVSTLAFMLGVALTTSLTGHAGDAGDFSWNVALDWVHVAAATTWTGGLLGLTCVGLDPTWPGDVLGVVARRFSRLAGWCLLAVVVTGGYAAWAQVRHLSAMWTTPYGRTLGVKLLIVLALVWCGAVNRYVVVPALSGARAAGVVARMARLGDLAALAARRRARPAAAARFRTYLGIEALLAVLVFGCTAALIDTTPARHARHTRHEADLDRDSPHEMHHEGSP